MPVPVYVGMRNWRPYIPDVVRKMRADGIEEAAVICMAPQNSRTSVGLYRRAVEAEAGNLRIDFTDGWARHPLLAEAFAERLRPASANWPMKRASRCPYSSPRIVFRRARFNPRRLRIGSAQLAGSGPGKGRRPLRRGGPPHRRAGRGPRSGDFPWWFAFQSQGASGGPWIGPSVEETLDSIAVKA